MRDYTYEKGIKLLLLNLAIGLGTFIQVLDVSIANVAIPHIAGSMSASPDQGTWVITSFAASNAIVLPLTGWLSDYFGRVRLFVWSLILFGLISFLCGLSVTLSMLVFFRVLQGAVAGALIPLSQSLITVINPPAKIALAMGFWGVIVVVAPILGPIIGGYLTETYSWPWIFYINVPICIFSASMTWSALKDHESEIKRDPIDWTGLVLLSVGVGALQIMLDKGKDLDWFESNVIIGLTILSIISLVYFAIWSYFQKYRIVDFSFFKIRNFALGTIAITLGYLIYFGSTVTLPLWLQTEQGYTAFWAGVAVAPVGLIPLFLSAPFGAHMHRLDLRIWSAISFFVFGIAFFYQGMFTSQVSLGHIMWVRFLQGFGLVSFFLPLLQISLNEVPKERYASASGLFHFVRILVGSGFGTSLSIQLWSRLEIFHYARLTETATEYRSVVSQFYNNMQDANPAFNPEVVNHILARQTEQQAYMLATNDIAWLGGWLFLCMVPMIFFCKPVRATQGPLDAAH